MERRFVKKWQHHYFGDAPDNLGKRNLDRGKLVFEQATCSRCHNIGPGEKKLGPDLTDVTKRFRGAKLLQQVVKPSSEIHKEFQTQMILVDDGRVLTGLVIEETEDSIRFIPQSAQARQDRDDREVSNRTAPSRRCFHHAGRLVGHVHGRRNLRPAGVPPNQRSQSMSKRSCDGFRTLLAF